MRQLAPPLPDALTGWDALAPAVERRLQGLSAGAGALEAPAAYALAVPGKRLRARMLLGWGLSGPGGEADLGALVEAAAAVELLHEASLAHDDICDHGLERRARPSLAAAFGVRAAGLTGAFFVGRAVEALARLLEPKGIELGLECLRSLSFGQILEAASAPGAGSRERYLEIAERKTGTLFRYPCQLGARLGGGAERPAASFAGALAVAFQILDDVLDLEGGDGFGKRVGVDLERGLLTWPILDWIDTSADPDEARARLLDPRRGGAALREEVLRSGAARRSRQVAAFELARARAILEALPPSPGRALLDRLLAEVAAR